MEDAAENAVLVIEWPDRAGALLPPDRLDVAFTLAPQQGTAARNVCITGFGRFAPRVERIAAMRRFLDRTGYGRALLRVIGGGLCVLTLGLGRLPVLFTRERRGLSDLLAGTRPVSVT